MLGVILDWPSAARYWVAFSGGMDSRVLLESLAAHAGDLPGRLAAIHIDHGLHPRSAEWARHCDEVCRRLGVPLVQERVQATPPHGSSPEAWARKLRYDALHGHISPGEMLLTAHHLDDQAETVLLQLVRGGGPAGLSGMPALRAFGAGRHGRPLLAFPRAELNCWAEAERLDWIEDESNADTRFDRNFLRSEILPRLMTRWAALPSVLARTAELQAQAARILADVAESDLGSCAAGAALDIDALLQLHPARRANAIREWLRRAGLPLPGATQMQLLEEEVIAAGRDRVPCLRWPGAELRRYRGRLYAAVPGMERDPRNRIRWRLGEPLSLQHGVLMAETGGGNGIRTECCAGNEVEVRFRVGGERIRPAGSKHRRDLRTLFQEQGVPPWVRDRIPLVYIDGKLAVVPGLWIDSEFSAGASTAAWQFRWMESAATADKSAP